MDSILNPAINWKRLAEVLHALYSDYGMESRFSQDIEYLSAAYEFTENLWAKQINRMSEVRLVMLSEAPLYGSEQSYIYNPDTKPTAFFHFNDLSAIIDADQMETDFDSPRSKKSYMIDCLAQNGFLFLDIFPFALNPMITAFNFKKMSAKMYNRLLAESVPFYLRPKLQWISEKSNGETQFVYRYKKLIDRTGQIVGSALQEIGLIPAGIELEHIGGTNMPLDRSKLSEICQGNSSMTENKPYKKMGLSCQLRDLSEFHIHWPKLETEKIR